VTATSRWGKEGHQLNKKSSASLFLFPTIVVSKLLKKGSVKRGGKTSSDMGESKEEPGSGNVATNETQRALNRETSLGIVDPSGSIHQEKGKRRDDDCVNEKNEAEIILRTR